MAKKYVISLDQGTTSSRAVLFDEAANLLCIKQKEFKQIYPQPGWVEHNPLEILESQLEVLHRLFKEEKINPSEIAAIGITNQRETTVVWDKSTGRPVYNAIVWQDRRTASICEDLKKRGLENYIFENTGLVTDAYFSGTKIAWILQNVPACAPLIKENKLAFGTIDTWLLWNLTNGKVHATDHSNASRTMLYNIKKLDWDEKLMKELGVPAQILPKVQNSSGHFGDYEIEGTKIPILGIAGDQQAALFGQACFEKGMAKNTYGTGCFMLMNTGEKLVQSKNRLLTTIAWSIDNKIEYALEGSIFIAGAAVQWLRDGIKIIDKSEETEAIAFQESSDEVYVVPAFAGLGAPYWDMYSRGAIFGLTRDTGRAEIVKATLQSMAYQTKDVLSAMEADAGLPLKRLKVDGGASANEYLMQFQADILGVEVERPAVLESTALGAAYLAGLACGMYNKSTIASTSNNSKVFRSKMESKKREQLYSKWKNAVNRTLNWLDKS